MPPSGYELGMGQFSLPTLGVFLIGFAIVCLAGWAFARIERAAMRDRSAKQAHTEIEEPVREPH